MNKNLSRNYSKQLNVPSREDEIGHQAALNIA